jgi:enoyl-CoA hydratase/carnithine racemase
MATDISGITLRVENRIATIAFTRVARRNALDQAAWLNLAAICAALSRDDGVRLTVLTGEGDHFCAGADIQELASNIENTEWMRANQAAVGTALDAWAALPMPTLAAVQGSAFGGGMALAISADFVVASNDARFAITPAKLGLSYRLTDCRRVVDCVGARRARELLLGARELDAPSAEAWGVVNRVVARDLLDATVQEEISRLVKLSGVSQRAIKSNLLKIRFGQANDDGASLADFARAFETEDFRTASKAFVEKRPHTFD